MRTKYTKLMSVWLCLAIIVSSLTVSISVAANAPATEELAPNEKSGDDNFAETLPDDVTPEEVLMRIKYDTGTTDEYGGGDFNQIRFSTPKTGLDAAFGVIWGTKDNPNSIIIYSIQARYLGVASIRDAEGNKPPESDMVNNEEKGNIEFLDGKRYDSYQALKVYTFTGLKLDDIIEFNDRNRDGMCNFQREFSEEGFTNLQDFEPIYNKQINLNNVEWKREKGDKLTNPDNLEKSWDFSLVAENQTYETIRAVKRIDKIAENNVLDKLEFTFHLTARLVPVEGVMVPHYEITVMKDDSGKIQVLKMERENSIECLSMKAMYDVKWDHRIEGWDYNETNKNPALLMSFHNIIGNAIPFSTAHWMKEKFLHDLKETGRVEYKDENGTKKFGLELEEGGLDMDDEAPLFGKSKPKKLKSNRIDFQGNWTRISRFQWVSDVTVDGNQSKMHAQIMGGIPFTFAKKFGFGNNKGQIVTGLAMFGAFTYDGGNSIYHDPSVDGDIYTELSLPRGGSLEDPEEKGDDKLKLVIISIIGIIVVVALIAGSMNIRRKRLAKEQELSLKEQLDKDTSPETNGDTDWEEYYEKKK